MSLNLLNFKSFAYKSLVVIRALTTKILHIHWFLLYQHLHCFSTDLQWYVNSLISEVKEDGAATAVLFTHMSFDDVNAFLCEQVCGICVLFSENRFGVFHQVQAAP